MFKRKQPDEWAVKLDRAETKIKELQHDNQRLRDLLEQTTADLETTLERMASTDPSDHDWRAEASGLAWMICDIHARYLFAKELTGGDSELLASSIHEAERWVNGPMLEYYEAGETNG